VSFADKTEPGQIETVAFEIELRHAPDKVWRALTDPTLLSEWLLPVLELNLEPGSAFRFKTQAYPGWDGTVDCRILEVEPHRRIKYTWDVPFLKTVVTFTLAPTTTGTRLTIVQSGFDATQKRESGGARYGWKMMGEKLITLLERTS
jgi:uncharacterized protein YndB with AHSA1/START domain